MVWTRCTRSFTGYIERLPRLKAVDARKKPPPIERGQDQTRLYL
jgi:hypothetical protein